MSEYQIENRTARVCGIIGAAAMCAAAIVPIALVAGAKHAPAQRRGSNANKVSIGSRRCSRVSHQLDWHSQVVAILKERMARHRGYGVQSALPSRTTGNRP